MLMLQYCLSCFVLCAMVHPSMIFVLLHFAGTWGKLVTVKFEVCFEDKRVVCETSGMPSYTELMKSLQMKEEVRIYCRRAEGNQYWRLTEHSMPSFGTHFVLKLANTTPPSSPEGIS